jgi:uncharacterized repeat protein (TIGR01451 family)
MESTRCNFRCLSVTSGLAIAVFALAAQAQTLNATLSSKAFNPVAIPIGGQSSLTVSFTNLTGSQINGVTFIDTLPAGVTAITFLSSGGCGGIFATTPTTVSATVSIAAGATCSPSYLVTANAPGIYTNSVANITSWNGNALAFPAASLVVGQINAPVPVPTLSRISLVLLALGVAAVTYRNRLRRAKSRQGRRYSNEHGLTADLAAWRAVVRSRNPNAAVTAAP